jgi:hypothetical protein
MFEDLWTRHFGGSAQYRYDFDGAPEGTANEPRVPLPARLDAGSDGRVRVRVWRSDPDGSGWAPRPATIWLEADGSGWRVAGVRY